MAQQAVTDEVGVRFGIGGAVLFVITGLTDVAGVASPVAVVVLAGAAALLGSSLDRAHAAGLAVAAWALATGFAVHRLGVLTFAPADLARLAGFVLLGTAVSTAARTARR